MIFVTSYSYTSDRYRSVFDFFTRKDDLTLILPDLWKVKGGKLLVRPSVSSTYDVITTRAWFYHSHYPIIKGLLKGWMPGLKKILRTKAKHGDVLFSATEPNLLVTYFNARIAHALGMLFVCSTWQNISYEKRLSGIKSRFTLWMLRKNLALTDGLLCGTERARDVIKPYLPPHIKPAVIPLAGVDTELFRPGHATTFRQEHALEGKLIFLFAAVFDQRKGILTAIRAFAKVRTSMASAHFVLIGMGVLEGAARALVNELSLNDAVTFLPWMANEKLAEILPAAYVFVHPSEPYRSWEEQYGWSILQASACGVPVIATRIGSIPEVVRDQETGILIEPGHVDMLADAMTILGNNESLRRTMGAAGRSHVEKHFSHAAVAHRMEDFLRSLPPRHD